MGESLISVVVPVYKVEPFLDACIESIVEQKYTRLEIILVDDGSPDNCGAMCDKWSLKDNRIRVIHKKNGGLSDARNAGLEIATGTYIAFVDSDDVIASDMLEQLVILAEQREADIVECDYTCFCQELPKKLNSIEISFVECGTQEGITMLLEENIFKYTVWNKLYRKEIFDALRFEKGKLHEDVFFTYQAFGLSEKIVKMNVPLYYYRQRNDSIMGQTFSIRNLDSLEARRRQYIYIQEKFSKLSKLAQVRLLGSCLYFGQLALRSKDKELTEQALKIIQPIFAEAYHSQLIKDNKKQKFWYGIANMQFRGCCILRNWMKIGL